MSDNLYLNERVAPHTIRYSQMTPLAFNAQSSKRIFFTSNQTTYSNTQTILRIPISSGCDFLDGPNSFIKFDYVNVEANPYTHTMANSANCLFYRVRVIADKGSDLENILFYNHCHAAISDLVLGPEKRATRAEQGYGNWGACTTTNAVDLGTAEALANQLKVLRNTSTAAPYWGCDEVSIAQGGTQTFCLGLDLSTLLGPGQKRFLPLFLMGGLTLEITLDPYGPMNSNASAPLFNIKNVEFHAQCITFSSDVNMALTAMTQQTGLFMHGCSWTNIMNSLPSSASSSWIISERLRSLKSLFIAFQDPAYQGAANWRSSARASNKLRTLQLKLGSTYYPPQQLKANANDASNPASSAEFLVETFKAIGETGNNYHSSMMNLYNFGVDIGSVNAPSAVAVGRPVYGLDLDAFGRSDVESGVNTIMNNPITVITNSSAAYVSSAVGGANPNSTLNAINFLYHDCVFSISPDGAVTVNK